MSPSTIVSASETPTQRVSPTPGTPSRTASRSLTASVSASPAAAPLPVYDPKTTTTAAILVGVALLVSAGAAVILCICTSASKMESAAQRAASEAAIELQEHADADSMLLMRRSSVDQAALAADVNGSNGSYAASAEAPGGRRASIGNLSSQDMASDAMGSVAGSRTYGPSPRRLSLLGAGAARVTPAIPNASPAAIDIVTLR